MQITGDISRAIEPRRWAALPEAAGLTALAWLANRIFLADDPGFARSLFNAYLLAVIAIAGRYGAPAGVFTAGLSVLAAATSRAVATGAPLLQFFEPAAGGPAAATLLLSALVVGGVAAAHRARLAALVELHARTRSRVLALEGEYRAALEEKDLEEKRLLADEGTFGAVVSLMDDLDRENPAEVPERLVRAMRRLLAGGTAALYRLGPEGGLLARAHGDAEAWPEALDPAAEPVVAAALAAGRVTSVATMPADEDHRPGRVLAACPLGADEDRYLMVAGDLPFVAFAPDRLAALAGCAALAGRALERARLFAATHDRNVVDRDTGACAFPFFRLRLAEEMALARRHGKALSVIALRDTELESLTDDELRALRRAALAGALKSALRDGDLLAHHDTGESFVLLLPFTNVAGARVVAARLREALAGAVRVHVVDVNPRTARPDDVVATISWHIAPAATTFNEDNETDDDEDAEPAA